MRRCNTCLVLLVMLSCVRGSYGRMSEVVGPDSTRKSPTIAQPVWPVGMVELLRHESRVYSRWYNGNESFFFKANPDEMNHLIRLFSQMRMRDHRLSIKNGKQHVKSFNGDRIDYNVRLHATIYAFWGVRPGAAPETHEPALTVFVDREADKAFWQRITLPANIILNSEVASCPLKGKTTLPKRRLSHARVQFDDGKPAADFEHGVHTRVTLWEKGNKTGIKLGEVNYKGEFCAAFSDKEIADLQKGASWLTLTVGNGLTEAQMDDPRLSAGRLSVDREKMRPVEIESVPSQNAGEIAWGEAVKGIQVRLKPDRRVWKAGETPAFKADLRNQGGFEHELYYARDFYEIQIDGNWCQWKGKGVTPTNLFPLDKGKIATVPVALVPFSTTTDGHKIRLVPGVDDDDAKALWESSTGGLRLTPGKHTIQVAFRLIWRTEWVMPGPYDFPIRAVSNPVEIEVLPAESLIDPEGVQGKLKATDALYRKGVTRSR